MAQKVFRTTSCRVARTGSLGAAPGFSPQSWSLRSRPSPANYPPHSECLCRGGALLNSPITCVIRSLSPPSATRPSGDGSTKTLFVPGSIALGSSHGIPTSPPKPGPFLICTNSVGSAAPSEMTNSSFAPTKRRAFRHATEFTRLYHLDRGWR